MFNVRLAGGHLYGKQLFTWLSLVVSFSPLDVLDEIWDIIESVSEGFLTYFYKGTVLHKLKKYFLSCRPATCLRGVRLLHDNASLQKAAIVREYLKQEKVVELPHPPYSPDLAPCDSRLKNTSLEENINRAKISVRLFFSV